MSRNLLPILLIAIAVDFRSSVAIDDKQLLDMCDSTAANKLHNVAAFAIAFDYGAHFHVYYNNIVMPGKWRPFWM